MCGCSKEALHDVGATFKRISDNITEMESDESSFESLVTKLKKISKKTL